MTKKRSVAHQILDASICLENLGIDVSNCDACQNALTKEAMECVTPPATHFVASLKSLLVNNFTATYSPSSNCEQDYGSGALDDLRSLVTGEHIASITHLTLQW